MDAKHFDRLARTLTEAGTRRGLLGLLATLPVLSGLFALLDLDETDAKGRRKRRKKKHKHGRPRSHGKRKKKKCKPNSLTKTCQGQCGPVKNNCKKPVDCGSCTCETHAQCGVDALCLADGSCQACTVTCPGGDPSACGASLQTALNAGGTVYVCPGTYQGGFTIDAAVTVIGAGEGESAASNSILDGNGTARVVEISDGTGTVELAQLRLTGGAPEDDEGGGIRHQGTTLRMTDCTITGNTANGNLGGGIFSDTGTSLELTRCTVSENHAFQSHGGGIATLGTMTLTDCLIERNDAVLGGGILCEGLHALAGSTAVRGNVASGAGGIYVNGGTLTIAETCRVTENTAGLAGNGGGIFLSAGTVALEGADPSPIVVDNCHENCAGRPVPKCAPGGTCPP
jgi:parallel beta-helix repeat protein